MSCVASIILWQEKQNWFFRVEDIRILFYGRRETANREGGVNELGKKLNN